MSCVIHQVVDWCPGLARGSRALQLHLLFLGSAGIRKGLRNPCSSGGPPCTTGFRNLGPFTEPLGSKRPCNYIGGCSPVGHPFNYSPQPLSAARRELVFCNDMGLSGCKEVQVGFLGAHLHVCLLESTRPHSFSGRVWRVWAPEATPQGRSHQCRSPVYFPERLCSQ